MLHMREQQNAPAARGFYLASFNVKLATET